MNGNTRHKTQDMCQCVRCQQDYKLTVGYRLTHICRQCRNGLVAVWAQVTLRREQGTHP